MRSKFTIILIINARLGDINSQEQVIDLLFNSQDFESTFSLLQPDDEQWLREWGDKRHDARAITLLLVGMENRYRIWNEEFTDEDSGQPFTVTRFEKIEGETLFPANSTEALRLYTQLCMDWQQTPRNVLYHVWNTLKCSTTLNYSLLLHHLADEAGDIDAQAELAEAYRYGDERNGIYRNPTLAQKYYEMTGDSYDPQEEEEDTPCEWTYTLTGNSDTLGAVKRLIDSLCQQAGTPDNELGLFVPLGMVMRVLVGSDAYRGNIISLEQPSHDRLVIRTEANEGNPLLYALHQCFENLTVEMS